MSSDGVKYLVQVAFEVDDAALGRNFAALSGRANDISGAWSRLGREITGVGRAVADSFTGAVEKAGSMAFSLAKVGAATAFGGAIYGVGVLNQELESTQTSLAAVLMAQGQVADMGAGFSKASDLMSRMRQDAKELPGSIQDLMGIFQSGVGAAGNAGLDAIKFEKLAAQAMAAGKALSVPLDQAGRELAQLMDGRAGAHNVFGSRLGIRADGFNQLGGAERVAKITEALGRFAPAISAYGNTFDAQFSTLTDNLKVFGQRATLPLFERLKSTLVDINSWLDNNQGTVSEWANKIGIGLRDAFDTGRQMVTEWWPAISTFASNAYDRLVSIWRDIRPEVEAVGAAIKDFLQSPESMDKIATILKLYAGVKVGGAASDSLGGVGSAGLGLYNAYSMQRLATSVATGAGTAGAGGAAAGGGALATLGTAAATAGAALAALGGVGLAVWEGWELKNDIAKDGLELFGHRLVMGSANIDAYIDAGRRDIASRDLMITANGQYLDSVVALQDAGNILEADLLTAAAAAQNAAIAFNSIGSPAGMAPADFTADVHSYLGMMQASGVAAQLAAGAAAAQQQLKPAAGKGGGGGSLAVSITINSSQAPGQIARAVVERLQQLRRHPNTSTRSPNYTTSRG